MGAQFCLGGEDVARGIAAFGAQGSGKTQAVILPTIADRMKADHSPIVTDVQGELTPYILQGFLIKNRRTTVDRLEYASKSGHSSVG